MKNKILKITVCIILIFNSVLLLLINYNLFWKKEASKEKMETWKYSFKKNDNFILLGDSITEWYPMDEMFEEEIPIVNSGIANNTTTDILADMKNRVYKYNPTKVFILIGTNDLKHEDSEEKNVETYNNIVNIVESIKNNRPYAKIYIESILPVNKNIKDNGTEERTNEEIKSVNTKIEDYCIKNNITYINLFNKYYDETGNMNSKYTTDGLHLNTKGYIIMTRELLKYMQD